jgi:hypothetical protein
MEMKLLSVNLARAIWLGHISDFNPRGASLYRVLYPFLVDSYKFKTFPKLAELSDLSKGISFKSGEFTIDGQDYPITINLDIHTDGFVVDSGSDTAYSHAFLVDVFEKFSEVFKMPKYETIIKKRLYLSQLYVQSEKTVELLNPKLKLISEYLKTNVEQGGIVFQAGGISFWPDQTGKANPAPFTFERALGVPFSENRYYSAAPLQTDEHLELLDKLESVLL